MSESLPWTDEYVDGLHTRIEELEKRVAMWIAVHDSDRLRIDELERALREIRDGEQWGGASIHSGLGHMQCIAIARAVLEKKP
jgi:hypothetical protein